MTILEKIDRLLNVSDRIFQRVNKDIRVWFIKTDEHMDQIEQRLMKIESLIENDDCRCKISDAELE